MALTDEQLHEIRRVIRRHHLAAIARTVGLDALSPEEQELASGLDLTQEDTLDESYQFGQLLTMLDDPALAGMTYTDFKTRMVSQPIPLTATEQRAVRVAKHQAAQYIRGLGNRVEQATGQAIFDAEHEERVREQVRGEVVSAREQRKTSKELAAALGRATKDYTKDWDKIAVSEMHYARQHGIADRFRASHGKDVRVYKQVMADACVYCRRLHIGPDGAPRIFKLSELAASNIGLRKNEWRAVVGPVHPVCQCELIRIPEGWGFDEANNLMPGGTFGIEYASEKTAKKAMEAEDELAKAFRLQGSITYQGLDIAIEQKKGSVRHWEAQGRKGSTTMIYAYGYIRGTQGSRSEGKDEYDVFVGPVPDAPFVYVVHQAKQPKFIEWDEDKAMLGFANPHHAKAAYLAHYDDVRFFGSMSQMPISEFKAKVMQTKGPAEDGMVKASGPRLIIKAGPTLSAHQAAYTSQAGGRAVREGSSGPNILFQSPQPPHQNTNPEPRHKQLEEHVKKRAEDAAKRRKHRIRSMEGEVKRGVGGFAEPVPNPPRPYKNWDGRAEADEEVRSHAPERKKWVQEKLNERNQMKRVSPYKTTEKQARLVIRPELLAERMAPPEIGDQKKPQSDEGVARVSKKKKKKEDAKNSAAPGLINKSTGTLTLPYSTTVEKRGLGSVTLGWNDVGTFEVSLSDGQWQRFGSLTQACDHVWVLAKGFGSIEDYRAQTGKRKVPSGAGWRFWGLTTTSA